MTAPSAEFQLTGKQIAIPFYTVDVNGNPLSLSTVSGNVNLNQVSGVAIALGQTVMASSLPVVIPSDQVLIAQPRATTSSSLLSARLVSAASINATNVKATPGVLHGYTISNTTASTFQYVKFWNKATAPVPSTDASLLLWTVGIHGSETITVMLPYGLGFSSGISYATTTNPADTDATAVGAGDIIMSLLYI